MSNLDVSFRIECIDAFSDTMSNLERSTKRAFDGVKVAGAAVTGASAAMTAGLGMAVNTAANFEQSISKVGALSGATGKELDQLSAIAQEMGSKTSYSAVEASEGLQALSMAGFSVEDQINALPGVLNAAAAGGTDLGETADIASNILSGFGIEASKTGHVADVLTKTFTTSNTTMGSLSETMKYLAPVAKASGQSLEEMSAATGLLGSAGIAGSQAGTSLAMSLTRLASPSKEAATLMKDLGFNAFDTATGAMKPLNQIIGDLESSTAGLTQQQKLSAISTIFGAESAKSMLTLLEAGQGTIANYTNELKNSGGTAQQIATTQLDNLKGQLKLISSAFEGAAISIGTALLPAVKVLALGVQWLLDGFNALSPGIKSTVAVVAALTAAFGLVLGPVLIAIGFLPALISGLTALATAAGTTVSGLLAVAGVATGVVAALVAIGVGLVIAYKKVGWFRDAVNSAWASIKSAFKTALTFIRGVVKTVMTEVTAFLSNKLAQINAFWTENGDMILQATKNVWGVLKSVIQGAMSVVSSVMETVWPVIKFLIVSTWNAIKGVINGALNVIMGLVKTFAGLLTGDFSAMWSGIKQMFSGAVQFVWNLMSVMFIGKIGAAIKGFAAAGKAVFSGFWGAIKSLFTSSTSAVKNVFTGVFNFLKGFLNNTLSTMKNAVTTKFSSMKSAVTDKMGAVKDTIKNIWNDSLDFLKSIDLVDVGKDIISGLGKGIKSMAGSVMSKVSDIANGIKDKITGLLDIHSPSRVMIGIGKDTGKGLVIGLDDMLPQIERTSLDMAKSVVPKKGRYDAPRTQQNSGGTTYGDIHITMNARDLAEVKDVHELFSRLKQEYRAR
ncbi:phage tail tape measure protein [Pontibacillus salipaludis]|uniref:Phage tail tape measure protein domain-containing protein n=1 Tax=Pontibacillus salipaludis TaxID=1697394 RepID=A0ABQ1PZW2_9BACI|nr:phage tail tape measure protein [Pontibacillus salipaludis]GGD07666.1 hypothetical protein GCM10011389_14050 [Pontibacillus salipaludis]